MNFILMSITLGLIVSTVNVYAGVSPFGELTMQLLCLMCIMHMRVLFGNDFY